MSESFPCAQCGGQLEFKAGTESLTCPYCGHQQTIPKQSTEIVEYDFRTALAKAPTETSTDLGGKEVRCEGCGSHTVITGQAGRCLFCDAPLVLVESPQRFIQPASLLAFKIEREAARVQFKKWTTSRWFAPSDLRHRAEAEGMQGVYLPYWTYDARTSTHYTGRRGDHYYETEHYTENGQRKTRQVQKTRWSAASGRVDNAFDDVLVPASKGLPTKLLDDLEPWDLSELKPFERGYLAGFSAEVYAVDLAAGFTRAEEKMKPTIEGSIRSDIGGNVQQISSMHVTARDVTFKHLLLPLWISSFRYGAKVYRFTVNARTGEVAGERPWSAIKIALAVMAALFALVVMAVVLALFSQHR